MIHHPPIMVDPMGSHWQQPSRSEVLIDGECAVMTRKAFNQLHDYSHSMPSGVYDGKMWKAQFRGQWYLKFYRPSEKPGHCRTEALPILLLEDSK